MLYTAVCTPVHNVRAVSVPGPVGGAGKVLEIIAQSPTHTAHVLMVSLTAAHCVCL